MKGRTPSTRRAASARESVDGALLVTAGLLVMLGVVMNYSTTAVLSIGEPLPPLVLRHLLGVGVAVAVAVAAYRVPLEWWRQAARPLWIVSLVLLGLVLVVGAEANGASRWLLLPGLPFAIQPSEPARLATVLALAAALGGKTRVAPGEALRQAALFTLPTVGLLLLQPDLSSSVVLVAIVSMLLFAAGLPLRRLALPGAGAAAVGGLFLLLNDYALDRVKSFLDPWRDASGDGFQLVQSFVAFGRGGTLGVGVGDGRQKLFYLPEAHTDFILSVVAEELGLVGVLAVIGAFATFAIAGLRVARRAREPFPLLVAFGMTALVVVPAGINAGVVMGLLPTTGLTLPFLSHGSNALVCCAAATGILLRTAAHEAPPVRTRVRGASPRAWART